MMPIPPRSGVERVCQRSSCGAATTRRGRGTVQEPPDRQEARRQRGKGSHGDRHATRVTKPCVDGVWAPTRYVGPMDLLEILRCPLCGSEVGDNGSLCCTGCGRTFDRAPRRDPADAAPGPPGRPGEAARGPRAGSRRARAEGWYEPDDAVDAVLPFVNREPRLERPQLAGERALVRDPPRPLHQGGARAARPRGRCRKGMGGALSGSSATASSSRPTFSSTRGSASAAARFYGDFGPRAGRRRETCRSAMPRST